MLDCKFILVISFLFSSYFIDKWKKKIEEPHPHNIYTHTLGGDW